MKPNNHLRLTITASAIIHLSAPSALAAPYYWDSNDTAAGFGNTTGTWGTDAFWSTSAAGTAATANTTITDADVVNFGTATLNYANGTIGIAAPVTATSIVFGAGQSTDLTIGTAGGSSITLDGATRTIVANSSDHTIAAPISITGNSTVTLNVAGAAGSPPRTLTLGVIGGTGNMVFQNIAGGNPNPARFILNGQSTYSGTTLLDSTNTNANLEMLLGITNALPTSTVLTIDGGNGTGSGRVANFDMNGMSQTLAGLTNISVSARTQNILNASATLSTLTVNDGGNRTLSARIGSGGTNIEIVKQGTGIWTLSGANSYTGQTRVEAGTITVSSATALGSTAGNTVVSSGARVFTGTNNISIAEAFNITGSGINGNNGAINIGGNATGVAFTGGITLGENATIQGDGGTSTTFSGGIDAGANTLSFNGSGTITVDTTGISGAGGSVVKNTGGVLNLSVANDYTGLTTVNGGSLRVQHANALGTTAAGTEVNATSSARVELVGDITVTGEALTISGTGNFLGALSSFSGNNEWAGPVTIGAAGTRIGASAGANLEVSGVIDSGIVNTGLVIRTSDLTGSVILSGANTYLGDTTVLIGKLQIAGGDNRLPVGTSMIFSSSGANADAEFDLNGRNQEVAGLSLTGTAAKNSINNSSGTESTLTVNTAAGTPSTFGGILKGNLALTKSGASNLTLDGTNTYTGATLVSAGTLFVNGSLSESAVTVESNGGIGGSGSLNSGLSIDAGGKLDLTGAMIAADSTGILSITGGSLTLGNLAFEDLVGWDWMNAEAGTYELIDGVFSVEFGGTAFTSEETAYEFGNGKFGYFTSGSLNAVIIVPEPSTALLGAIGLIALLRRRSN